MQHSIRRAPALVLVLALLAGALAVMPAIAARAAGSPDIALTRTVAAKTLFGSDVAVTLTATNPTASDGFNLTLTDVLPAGATLTGGTAPDQTVTLSGGRTLLVWNNVSDLQHGTSQSVAYTYTYPTNSTFNIGKTIAGTANAYVNDTERQVPAIDGTGAPSNATGSATATSSTTFVPFVVTKQLLDYPENELLRGVHDHKAAYKITITNNLRLPTSNVSVDDYLPADLEFLGCPTLVDNTAGTTTEYTGLGRITGPLPSEVTTASCLPGSSTVAATTVTTDPDGAAGQLPNAVYTKATWTGLPSMAASAVDTIIYAAAVPMHENVQSSENATANLDNNTGALTSDEEQIVNYAKATGTTSGTTASNDAYETATAEDVAIQKTASTDAFVHGSTTTWTLTIESSEYTTSTGAITVTDTVPDGLVYSGTTTGPANPTVTTNSTTGTQTVVWSVPAFTAKNGTAQIVYTTTTLSTYRKTGQPVANQDTWTNSVHLATNATNRNDAGTGTQTLAVIDDSQATQTAAPVTMNKEVAEPQASVNADCSNVTTWEDDASGSTHGYYHPGDTVCWRLTVDFPSGLDALNNRIRDILPSGFDYVGFAPTTANTATISSNPTSTTPANDPQNLTWTVAKGTGGTKFQVIVTTKWSQLAGNDGQILGNLMKLSYQNTAGSVFQDRDLANVQQAQPVLSLAKTVDSATGAAGDSRTFTITIGNSGHVAAINTALTDVLPAGWTCASITNLGGGTCNPATNTISWSGVTVAALGSTTRTVVGTVPADAGAGDVYTNTAAISSYQTATNTGGTFGYTSGLTSQATVTVPSATISKAATPANVRIGDTITFTLSGSIPAHTTLYNSPEITDTLPAGLTGISATTTVGGAAGPAATVSGSNVTAPITTATSFANTTANPIPVVVTVTARATGASLTAPTTLSNTAYFAWTGSTGAGSVDHNTPSNTTTETVVEPVLGITKTDDVSQTATPGGNVTYTLTATNTGTAASYDSRVTDVVPTGITPHKSGGGLVSATGDAVDTTGSDAGTTGVWNATNRTITFTLGTPTIAVGGSAKILYAATIANPLVSNGALTNTATVTGTSMPGVVAGERTSYAATTSDTLRNAPITLTKAVTPTSATVGQRVTYTVTATIPANTFAYDTLIDDQLPADVSFESLVSSSCAPSCSVNATVVGAPPASATEVGFWLGDITASASQRVVTIVYTGIVRTSATRGETMTNTATVDYNSTDKISGTPVVIPTGYDTIGDSAQASVTEVEPQMAIAKSVAGGITGAGTAASPMRATPGTVLTYTVAATNTGTSSAFTVAMRDTLPHTSPTQITCAQVSTISNGGVCSAGVITWGPITEIAANDTWTNTYRVTIPATWNSTEELTTGAELQNIADVPSYYGLNSGDSANVGLTPKHYTEDPTSEADVELDLASLAGNIWTEWPAAGNTVGVEDASDWRMSGIPVTVTFAGADGIFGTPDDEVHTAVTQSDGSFKVINLPGGAYRVTVDATTLTQAGLVPAWDADGVATQNTWDGTLGQAEDKTHVDFSYQGTSSIGDTVYLDLDRDGSQNTATGSNEKGIPGATVTLTNNVRGTTVTTTTDASGHYLFPTLPAGPYTVTVTPPAGSGLTAVGDADSAAGSGDGTSTLMLPAGSSNLNQDFGYVGPGAIGDRVWLDRDRDGVQNPDHTIEPGLVGAGITVTWLGNDGVAGGGDDETFTTTTGADGAYSVTGIPLGKYSVAVTGGLPAGATETWDADGILPTPNASAVTLTSAAPVNTAQDFGYDARTSIGDYVWWDANGDGVQDANEPGLPGVPVTVLYAGADGVFGTADDISYSTTTDSTGHYEVPNISQGKYRVTVTPPTGFAETKDADSTGNTGLGNQSEVTIDATGNQQQDFGYRGAGSIGDRVWYDVNADGVQDAGEPGVGGVTVTLTATVNGVVLTRTATTAADGSYSFPGLPVQAMYTVAITDPAGYRSTYDLDGGANLHSTSVGLVVLNANPVNVDFGVTGTGSLGDTVWLDQNGDGTQQASEPGIPGARVNVVWYGPDGVAGGGDDVAYPQLTTDASGKWNLPNLPAGTFSVTVSNTPAGLTVTGDPDATKDGASVVTLAAGATNLAQDFGYQGAASVGDIVWLDVDGDGVQDASDPGLSGIPVTVRSAGADGILDTADDILATATTDANGHYLVEGLPGGPTRVSYSTGSLPAGDVGKSDLDGGTTNVTEFTLGAMESKRDVDYVVVGTSKLQGVIYNDRNGDGTRQSGEGAVEGITIIATWTGPNGPVELRTTSGTDGTWSFPGIPAGSYSVRLDPTTFPAGFHASTAATVVVAVPAGGVGSAIFGITTHVLAATGLDALPWLGLALLLLLAGAAVVVIARRRPPRAVE